MRFFNYLVFKHKNTYLLKERDKGDIWTGMYEFLLEEKELLVSADELLHSINCSDHLVIEEVSNDYKHILTHQTIFARFSVVGITSQKVANTIASKFSLQAFNQQDIKELPKPVLIIKFLDDYVFD